MQSKRDSRATGNDDQELCKRGSYDGQNPGFQFDTIWEEESTERSYRCHYNGLRNDLPVRAELTVFLPWGDKCGAAYGLWDTGANKTTISKQFADNIGIVPVPPMDDEGNPITTANVRYIGTVTASLRIGKMLFPCLMVAVNDLDPNGAQREAGNLLPDILIGMDVISQGRFTVDSTSGETVLTFEPDF